MMSAFNSLEFKFQESRILLPAMCPTLKVHLSLETYSWYEFCRAANRRPKGSGREGSRRNTEQLRASRSGEDFSRILLLLSTPRPQSKLFLLA